MPRTTRYIAISIIIALTVWIYWTTNSEVDNTLTILNDNKSNKLQRRIKIQPSACNNSSPFILILVTSYVGHVELRSAHRRAIPDDYLREKNIERIFLLAEIPPHEQFISQAAIEDESKAFGDILQGSFTEHYRNLTYKHLMGLDFAARQCASAQYILKVDDDTVLNIADTITFLKNKQFKNDLLLGYMLNNTRPRRKPQNKWYVTMDEYSRNEYPPYLSGWYYITTPHTAARLVEESIYHPYFWIDDILVTGILAEALNIKLKQLPEGFWLEYYELLECCMRDMMKKHIKCEYVVGPNGGRTNLIYEFYEAIRSCDKTKHCSSRPDNQPLKKSCVAFKDRDIFSVGRAEIKQIVR